MSMRFPLSPAAFVRNLWSHRDLVWQMTERDALARYRGTAGGLFWVAFTPLLMLGIYTVFFTEVFPTKWGTPGEGRGTFALIIFVGLLLHGFLAETLARAPTLIVANANLVKKVVFPLDLLPVVSLASSLFHLVIGLLIWFLFFLFASGLPPLTALWLPVILLPLAMIALGAMWILASLGVYLRDVGQIVPLLTSVLLFASPVFYRLEALPGHWRNLVQLGPLAVPIEQARRVLLWGQAPEALPLAIYWVVALLVLWLGLVWFQGTRKGFADVL